MAESPTIISVKKIPIESTCAEFWNVWFIPPPAPRCCAGRLFITPARFGEAKAPIEALGEVDVLLLPVGGGPTIAPDAAAELVGDLRPRLVVPMHYRTPAIGFLDPPDAFIEALKAGSVAGQAGDAWPENLGARVEQLESNEAEVEPLLGSREEPVVALLAPPV